MGAEPCDVPWQDSPDSPIEPFITCTRPDGHDGMHKDQTRGITWRNQADWNNR